MCPLHARLYNVMKEYFIIRLETNSNINHAVCDPPPALPPFTEQEKRAFKHTNTHFVLNKIYFSTTDQKNSTAESRIEPRTSWSVGNDLTIERRTSWSVGNDLPLNEEPLDLYETTLPLNEAAAPHWLDRYWETNHYLKRKSPSSHSQTYKNIAVALSFY